MWAFVINIQPLLLWYLVNGQAQPKNCADIYRSNKFAANGTYTVYNRQHQSLKVYCEFHHGFGYTYVDLSSVTAINLADLYTDTSHVLIRDVRNDGHQYQSRVEQLARYTQYKLSLQFNAYAGYAAPQNVKMTPYIYVGFLPAAAAKRAGMIQGYRVNGVDYTFTNCDANPNSYIVFLKNKNHLTATGYNPQPAALVQEWDLTAKPVPSSSFLPAQYFSFFEVHFGGCGGYGTAVTFNRISAAAVGLRYDMTCREPPAVFNATKSGGGTAVGSVVRYTCNVGYKLLKGDAVRTCLETGQYTGILPFCGKLPCDSSPCQNGGMCFETGTTYVCECMEGYDGQNCQTSIGR